MFRAVEAYVAVGGLLLDVGRDDGRVGDAGLVQTVMRGDHVVREPGGQKTLHGCVDSERSRVGVPKTLVNRLTLLWY